MAEHVQLLDRLRTVHSEIELTRLLRETASQFSMSHFAIYDVPDANAASLRPYIRLTNMSAQFYEEFDRHELLQLSALFRLLQKSTAPKVWCSSCDGLRSSDPRKRKYHSILAKEGLTCTAMIPVHRCDGSRGAVAFGGARGPINADELSSLCFIAAHAYEAFETLTQKGAACQSGSTECGLTARELEVLDWAANGKTTGEIASILSLSDHTVNTYMNSAMRKMDCVNRTQLVAKALRLNLIN
ncbi:LuxR family transcriptional regulator [Pseudohoeflea suaedae]|uniref:LuxR family transcriptional regulator n=1 Tax=Pseudohoeflea suaedae TaxID=877384 RepID=A0A4R5PIN6_9HYPH|nr:LuxR family transcriptional regulator [Pseudohoeflea suaedae]TDH34415.1 LuxR family transcriptional regulator [Pseudohoeflea suaedae]